jgi:hypothetical protein
MRNTLTVTYIGPWAHNMPRKSYSIYLTLRFYEHGHLCYVDGQRHFHEKLLLEGMSFEGFEGVVVELVSLPWLVIVKF